MAAAGGRGRPGTHRGAGGRRPRAEGAGAGIRGIAGSRASPVGHAPPPPRGAASVPGMGGGGGRGHPTGPPPHGREQGGSCPGSPRGVTAPSVPASPPQPLGAARGPSRRPQRQQHCGLGRSGACFTFSRGQDRACPPHLPEPQPRLPRRRPVPVPSPCTMPERSRSAKHPTAGGAQTDTRPTRDHRPPQGMAAASCRLSSPPRSAAPAIYPRCSPGLRDQTFSNPIYFTR